MSQNSRGSKRTIRPGVFSAGDRVEVLSSEEGFSDAWAAANVISQHKGGLTVEYSKFVDADGTLLREKVRYASSCCCRDWQPGGCQVLDVHTAGLFGHARASVSISLHRVVASFALLGTARTTDPFGAAAAPPKSCHTACTL